MELFNYLTLSLVNVLRDYASSKTKRYFLRDVLTRANESEDDDGVSAVIGDVVRTFIAILSRKHVDSMIEVDDENYPVRSYEFPVKWWELAKARIVYTSRSAAAKSDPYFKVDALEGNLLTPLQVRQFFEEYNANQGDLYKIVLGEATKELFGDGCTVFDFKAFCFEDGMVHANEAGSIEPEVAQILGVESPFRSSSIVSTFGKDEGRIIERWLMSVE